MGSWLVHTIYKQTIDSSNTKPFTQYWPNISEGLDCGIAISDGQTRQLLKPCPLTLRRKVTILVT